MILGRRRALLRRRDAANGAVVRWWRDLEARSARLLWRGIVIHVDLSLLALHIGLLGILVNVVGLLPSHWVIDRIEAWLSSRHRSNDWLHILLRLLIHGEAGSDWRGSKLLLHLTTHIAQIHALELLCGSLNVDELLLQSLLLFCQIHIRSDQLSIQIWIHLFLAMLIDMNLGRGEDLLRQRVHLAVVVAELLGGERGADGSLRSSISRPSILLIVRVDAAVKASVLELSWWRRWRIVGRVRRLGSCSQSRKQVRATGSRCRSAIILIRPGRRFE